MVFAVFGTSIPTRDLPGIGASIRIGCAAKARARSLLRPTILESFTPSAGLRAYRVTEGPIETSSISTVMLKFCNVRLMMLAFAFISPVSALPRSFSRRVRGGGVNGFMWGTVAAGINAASSASVNLSDFDLPAFSFC